MVTPEHYYGIVTIGAVIKGVKDTTDLFINKGPACKISSDTLTPGILAVVDYLPVQFACHLYADRRNIIEVIFVNVRQCHALGVKHVKIFLGCTPSQMGLKEATRQEEGFVVFLPEPLGGPGGNLVVVHILLSTIDGAPFNIAGRIGVTPMSFKRRGVSTLRDKLVPGTGTGIGLTAMIYFPAAHSLIAVSSEMLVQSYHIGHESTPGIRVLINAGG